MTTTEIISELGFKPTTSAFDARLIAQSKYWMRHGKLVELSELSHLELQGAIVLLRDHAETIEFQLAWYEHGKDHHWKEGDPVDQHVYDIPVATSPLLSRLVELEGEPTLTSPDDDEFLAGAYAAIERDPVKQLALSWIALRRIGSYYVRENVHWNLNNRRYPEAEPDVQETILHLRDAIDMAEGRLGFDGERGTQTLRNVMFHIKNHGGSVEKWETSVLAKEAVMQLWKHIPDFSVHAIAEGPTISFSAPRTDR